MDKTGFKKIKNPETSINNRFSETVLYGEEKPSSPPKEEASNFYSAGISS